MSQPLLVSQKVFTNREFFYLLSSVISIHFCRKSVSTPTQDFGNNTVPQETHLPSRSISIWHRNE